MTTVNIAIGDGFDSAASLRTDSPELARSFLDQHMPLSETFFVARASDIGTPADFPEVGASNLTVAQLDALPLGSEVKDPSCDIWTRGERGWSFNLGSPSFANWSADGLVHNYNFGPGLTLRKIGA